MTQNLGRRAPSSFSRKRHKRISSKLFLLLLLLLNGLEFFGFNTPIAPWASALNRKMHGQSRTQKSNPITQFTHLL